MGYPNSEQSLGAGRIECMKTETSQANAQDNVRYML